MFFRSGFEVQMTSMKSRRLPGSLPDDFQEVFQTTSRKSSRRLPGRSRLDFQEVVWTSWKSSGLPGSRLDFLEVVWTSWKSSDKIWKTSGTTYLLVVWKSCGLHGSLLTKSSGLPKSCLTKSSGLPVKSSGSRLDFL
ncbi:unnamed protein product, partial [Brassica oleracea var. botrytis]